MAQDQTPLRAALPTDLEAVNALIERAVMTWDLPERVKRLSLPSYRYHRHDMEHMTLALAERPGVGIVGVAAWEPAVSRDLPAGRSGLLLHGIYVEPALQRSGIGRRLLGAAEAAARRSGLDGLLVKAQPGAEGFFRALGLEALDTEDPLRHYAHRFWKLVER